MRRVVLVVIGLAVLVSGAVMVSRFGESDEVGSSDLSVEVSPDDGFMLGPTVPDHRIVYRVTRPDGRVETDRLVSRGPFESRLEAAPGSPPGGTVVSVLVATIDRLAVGGMQDPATVARVPGLAPSSFRLAPVLDAAVSAGLLEIREQRVVADRRCQVYRTGGPLSSSPLRPIRSAEFADSCVDTDGLLLEETLFVDGEIAVVRTAISVEIDVDPPDEAFAVGDPTAPVDQGGGQTTPADPTTAPIGPFFVVPTEDVPDGFAFLERYSVIPPQTDRFADPAMREDIIAGVADVYVDDDGGFFVIYQGATLGRVLAYPSTPGAPTIQVGSAGEGEVLLSAAATEVRVPLSGGRFVHVVGPLEPDTLTDIGFSLVETQGEGLVLLEE